MHKQTTTVNPTGVNKIPRNFDTPPAATAVAVQLFKGLSARPMQWPFGVKWLITAVHVSAVLYGHHQAEMHIHNQKSMLWKRPLIHN